MKLLLTGASGFVGSALCDELTRQGHDVFALMRKSSSAANLRLAKFTPVLGDLRDPASLREAVAQAEVILHVAGVVMARSKEEFFLHNVEGTRNLVQAATEYAPKLQRFIFISSLAAAGPSTVQRPRREEDMSLPISFYGQSKLAAEEVVRNSSLPSVIFRPPAVYGPRDRSVFTFFQLAKAGIRLGLGGAEERRYSFIHVDDLVQGILLATSLEKKIPKGEIFYLSGDGEASWDQAMEAIATALGKKGIRLPLPLPVLTGVGGFYSALSRLTGKVFPLSLDKVKELKAVAWTCDNAKAKKILGFTPYWDLTRGLEQTARWYCDHSWL